MKSVYQKRRKLKFTGIFCLIFGLIFFLVAIIDFIFTFFSGIPKLFFLFFIGIPLIFIGVICLIFANIEKLEKLTLSESSLFFDNSYNNESDDKKDLSNSHNDKHDSKKECPYCLMENDYSAQYCKNCGKKILKLCKSCNKENAVDAKFCDRCGKELNV